MLQKWYRLWCGTVKFGIGFDINCGNIFFSEKGLAQGNKAGKTTAMMASLGRTGPKQNRWKSVATVEQKIHQLHDMAPVFLFSSVDWNMDHLLPTRLMCHLGMSAKAPWTQKAQELPRDCAALGVAPLSRRQFGVCAFHCFPLLDIGSTISYYKLLEQTAIHSLNPRDLDFTTQLKR